MTLLLFIVCVALANIVTAATTPFELGPWLVTWGTLFAGITFVLRDFIQREDGKDYAYRAVLLGLLVALVTSLVLGDTTAVVCASALAFAVGMTLDTEVYSRLHKNLPARVFVSGVLGGLLDTAVFVVVGLSPLWSGIIPWSAVDEAIVGVWLVKSALQLAAAVLTHFVTHDDPVEA